MLMGQSINQLKKAVIVDVDGTVAIRQERKPFEWSLLETDKPNLPVIDIVNRVISTGVVLLFVSGREEKYRFETINWLSNHISHPFEIYFRENGDLRRDDLVKQEIFQKFIKPYFDVIAVFDDRTRVVKMWRDTFGLPCFQVAPGDF